MSTAIATPSTAVDATTATATSPTTPALNPSLLQHTADLKDRRAYERYRQKAHKVTDRLRSRSKVERIDHGNRSLWRLFGPPESADTERVDLSRESTGGHWDDDHLIMPLGGVGVEDKNRVRLDLAELIERKGVRVADRKDSGKKKRRLGNDVDAFEVIPHLRSVIVLDDFAYPASPRSSQMDEWEYVSPDGESSSSDDESGGVASTPPTYAQVLANLANFEAAATN